MRAGLLRTQSKPWMKVAVTMPVILNVTVMRVSDLANQVESILYYIAIFVSVMQRYVNRARVSRRNALSLRKRPLQSSAQLKGQKRAAAAATTPMPMEMQIQVCRLSLVDIYTLGLFCECL